MQWIAVTTALLVLPNISSTILADPPGIREKIDCPRSAPSTKRFIRSPTNRERIIVFDAHAWAVTDLAADDPLGYSSLTLRTHFELY
jgi:hypothetical protein